MNPAPAFTRADALLVRALASLASVQPEKARAAHLVAPAEDLARRLERADTPQQEVI